jgi:hypothetical protein
MKASAVLLAGLLGFAVLMLPATAVAQQGKAGAGNAAKAQACRAEASQMARRGSSKGGGGNIEASRAQARGYYQQCMAR